MAHKVFVSYHHANDQKQADHLRDTYGNDNTLLDKSLDEAYEDMSDDEILAEMDCWAFIYLRQELHLRDYKIILIQGTR